MRKAIITFLFLFSFNTAYSKECFLFVEQAGNINPKIISTLGISLISQYIEKLESTPLSGIGKHDCVYKVSVTESKSGLFVTIAGREMSAYGDSKLGGVDGLQQALLRSIYRSKLDRKKDICNAYSTILKEDCYALGTPTSTGNTVPINIKKNAIKEKNFLFEPPKCGHSKKGLTCTLLITNLSSDRELHIENGSRAFDDLGNEYKLRNRTGRLQIANKWEQWGFGRMMISNVPVKVILTFYEASSEAKSVALLEYVLRLNREEFSVKFRNTPIGKH